MPDRPIIFSAAMIAALLAGRKTQTRRILKPQPFNVDGVWWTSWRREEMRLDDLVNDRSGSMPYRVGDRLWVKETWCRDAEIAGRVHYRADGEHVVLDDGDGFTATNKDGSERSPWKSSLFMSRGLSRLTLLVTDVRVERLQDISEADAKAEGIFARGAGGDDPHADVWTWQQEGWRYPHPAEAFKALWSSIHGPDAWAENPWLVAVTFSVHARNIDQLAPIAEAAE